MLGMLQQLEVGRRRRFEARVVGNGKRFERMAGAIGTEILRHRTLNVLHGHRGAPAPECRRNRRQRIGTNRSACNRSIEDGRRASDSTT